MKKFMSLMLLVCACLLSQPVKAQQVTPDNAGYIVKVGDMAPDFEMEPASELRTIEVRRLSYVIRIIE